ncbi:MAG: EAL domain-containing protein [Acidimicrobiales bacterium]
MASLPVDALKIDRSFVDGLGRRRRDTPIVEAILALARSLGLDAAAEGWRRPTNSNASASSAATPPGVRHLPPHDGGRRRHPGRR